MKKERFLQNSFIPVNPVSLVLIDSRYEEYLKEDLKRLDIFYIAVEPCHDLYPAISCHPDIQCHPLGDRKIIIAPNARELLKNQLIQHGFEIIMGNTRLESNYPNNIAYNVARIGEFAFHNEKYTDPILKMELEKQGVEFIHVKQGYAKCSVAIVDQGSIITSDKGISGAAREVGLEVLTIDPGFIQIKDLNYGFIGGATGLLGNDALGFVGNWEAHKDASLINDFLSSRGKTCIILGNLPFSDIGSIVPLKEYSVVRD